jgi:hypothetical protein
MSTPIMYSGHISPPQIFVGTTFHEEDLETDEDEFWEQESVEISIKKIREGIESLGVKCLSIELGEYIPSEGVVEIVSIICEYDGSDRTLLDKLLTDEVYIRSGIKCYSTSTPAYAVAFYIVRM